MHTIIGVIKNKAVLSLLSYNYTFENSQETLLRPWVVLERSNMQDTVSLPLNQILYAPCRGINLVVVASILLYRFVFVEHIYKCEFICRNLNARQPVHLVEHTTHWPQPTTMEEGSIMATTNTVRTTSVYLNNSHSKVYDKDYSTWMHIECIVRVL